MLFTVTHRQTFLSFFEQFRSTTCTRHATRAALFKALAVLLLNIWTYPTNYLLLPSASLQTISSSSLLITSSNTQLYILVKYESIITWPLQKSALFPLYGWNLKMSSSLRARLVNIASGKRSLEYQQHCKAPNSIFCFLFYLHFHYLQSCFHQILKNLLADLNTPQKSLSISISNLERTKWRWRVCSKSLVLSSCLAFSCLTNFNKIDRSIFCLCFNYTSHNIVDSHCTRAAVFTLYLRAHLSRIAGMERTGYSTLSGEFTAWYTPLPSSLTMRHLHSNFRQLKNGVIVQRALHSPAFIQHVTNFSRKSATPRRGDINARL